MSKISKIKSNPRNSVLCLMIIIMFSVLTINTVNGQSIKLIKKQINLQRFAHIKGQQQVSIGGGMIANGFNATGSYGKYITKNLLFRTDIYYENAIMGLTTLSAYYISPEINYTINKVSNHFFIDAKVGLISGSENMSNKIMVNKKLNNIVFGEKIGLKFEYFIVPEVSLNLDVEQRFINNSKAGTATRNAYFSISFNF